MFCDIFCRTWIQFLYNKLAGSLIEKQQNIMKGQTKNKQYTVSIRNFHWMSDAYVRIIIDEYLLKKWMKKLFESNNLP